MASTLTITTDGQVRVNEWPEGDRQLLPHLYAEIETDLVTTINLPDGKTMWADDEALFKREPQINTLAVKLLGTFGELVSYVWGHVVLDGGVDDTGHSLPLTDADVDTLRHTLADLADAPLPELVAPDSVFF